MKRLWLIPLAFLLMAPTSGEGLTITDFEADTAGGVDVSTVNDTFSCVIDITGTVVNAGCVFESPAGVRYGCVTTTGSGVYTCTVTVPAQAAAGTYNLVHAFANSATGTLRATKSEVDGIGGLTGPTSFSVTSANEDTDPLAVHQFTISPTILDPAVGGTVTCEVQRDGADTGTLLDNFACVFLLPNGDTTGCAATGNSCSFDVGAGAQDGIYTLVGLNVRDRAGNTGTLTPSEVAALPGGGDSALDCRSTSGDPCSRVADLSSTGGTWNNSAQQTPVSESYITLFIRTTANGAQFALANDTVSASANAAVLVRIESGRIEALDGSTWRYDTAVSMPLDTWQMLYFRVDWISGVYSLWATTCVGGLGWPIAIDADFQTGADTTGGLDYFAAYGPGAVTADIADAMWLLWSDTTSCTPTTCGAQGWDCGEPQDLCGGILASCGTCGGGDTCGGGGTPYVCGQ